MPDEKQEKMLPQSEVNRLFTERLRQERRRFEAQLSQEKAARGKAEELLRQREGELRRLDEQQRQLALRRRAEEELDRRALPRALAPTLRLDSEDALRDSLDAAESAFRSALDQSLRDRLRLPAPAAAPAPAPAARKPALSYREAAQLYASDRAAYDKRFGR